MRVGTWCTDKYADKYADMYIRIQISIYASTYLCMYTYIYLYINIDTCIDVRIHTYLYVHTCKHICINVYTHIRFCWRWGKSLPEWISTIIMTYVDDIYWWCKCIFMTYSADMYVDIAGFYIVKTTRRLKLMPHSCGDIYLWHIPRVYILITYSWVLLRWNGQQDHILMPRGCGCINQ